MYIEVPQSARARGGHRQTRQGGPAGFLEPAVGKLGSVTVQDIAAIDGMVTWNDGWPTLYVQDHDGG